MLRVAICDDELYFTEILKKYLEEYFEKRHRQYEIDIFESGESFLKMKEEIMSYEIVFLDVCMGSLNGIETAKRIREYSNDLYIVFVTAYIDYSLEGYKVNAIRYLLKDSESMRVNISECIDAIIEKMDRGTVKKTFSFAKGKKEILLDRLVFIESKLHRIEFHEVGDEKSNHHMYGVLNDLESELKGYGFVRVHQSYLVNMKHISQIADYKVFLKDGQQLNIPRTRYREVKNRYAAYKGRM